jgi:hypothetical protein
MVRYEDGSNWELCYSYWNGTTLSRASTQFFDSSSGSAISLTSSATAALVADGNQVMPDLALEWRGVVPNVSNGTPTQIGLNSTTTGTGVSQTAISTNKLTERVRLQATSATTANAQAGVTNANAQVVASSSSGRGGWQFRCRFGGSALVTGQRMFVGMTSTTMVGQTVEPSAVSAHYAALGLDSTDSNFQLLVNSNAGSGTKTDTGIAFVANGLYDVSIWSDPGSLTVYMLLCRVDTGAIWYGSTATDVPATGGIMFPQCIGGLSSTTGTAFVLQFVSMFVRGTGG